MSHRGNTVSQRVNTKNLCGTLLNYIVKLCETQKVIR